MREIEKKEKLCWKLPTQPKLSHKKKSTLMEHFRERKKNRLLWNILGSKKKLSIHVLLIVHRVETITFFFFLEQAGR
jgi:hypothetical protein